MLNKADLETLIVTTLIKIFFASYETKRHILELIKDPQMYSNLIHLKLVHNLTFYFCPYLL
jgi:hypothetical protein